MTDVLNQHQREQLGEIAARELAEDLRLRKVERLLRQLEIPPLYANASLGSFVQHGTTEDRRAIVRVQQFATDYLNRWPAVEPLVVFRGGFGTGKGHIAWSLARALAASGHEARFVKLPSLVRHLREAWSKYSVESETAALELYHKPELLIIDEISRHAFYGQQIHQHLYDVLDWRLEQLKPTILTSNENDDELEAILRPALWDRLAGHGAVVEFGTASFRTREVPS